MAIKMAKDMALPEQSNDTTFIATVLDGGSCQQSRRAFSVLKRNLEDRPTFFEG
jgi:hypothetical protein